MSNPNWYSFDSRGEANRQCRITDDQVREIRKEYAEGMRGKARAEAYGLSAEYYNKIGSRRNRQHVED